MKKNEAVVLEVDVSGAELAIKDVGEGIRALKTLAKDIGAEISMAFAPLQDSLNMTVANTFSVTHAITEATTALQRGGARHCRHHSFVFVKILLFLQLYLPFSHGTIPVSRLKRRMNHETCHLCPGEISG